MSDYKNPSITQLIARKWAQMEFPHGWWIIPYGVAAILLWGFIISLIIGVFS